MKECLSHRDGAVVITDPLRNNCQKMLTQPVSSRKSVQEMFRSFPKATGFLRDIINAYENGALTEKELAEWLLEFSDSRPVSEAHTAVRQRYATTRRSRNKLNPAYRLVYHWMIRFKDIHPQTAWQYVCRLQKLAEDGYLEEGARALIARIEQSPDNFSNTTQCLSALRLLEEFESTEADKEVSL